MVRDAPPGHPFLSRTPEPPGEMLKGLVEVLSNPRLKPILALNFCNYACTFTVQGLWGAVCTWISQMRRKGRLPSDSQVSTDGADGRRELADELPPLVGGGGAPRRGRRRELRGQEGDCQGVFPELRDRGCGSDW